MSRSPMPRWLIAASMLLVGLALVLAHGPALADPPARAGRLADLTGTVWLYDADEREWVQMQRNQTVGDGDRLRADDGSGAVISIGTATMWLDQRSEVEFNALGDNRIAVQLVKGSVGLRLRGQESADEWSLRTLEGRFGFEREGLYRVSQLERGSEAQAWQGKLRFESRATDAQPVLLGTNEQAEFWWDNGPRTERQPLEQDGFARLILADSRDTVQPLVGTGTPVPYVSPEMTGAEDLARYGAWEQSTDYGAVWVPTVVVSDWAPYRYGRWMWSSRWGWTWVDDMPWGFAPFHYGRWAYWRDRWCWVPGPYARRPAYAPALVGGVGPGLSVGVVIGGRRPPPPRYGTWVPLAPREAWTPGYRHSPGYWRRLNPDPNPVTVVRPGERPPVYRHEREHGALFTQRPVMGPLPAAALQPQRSWPPRPSDQTVNRPDGRPIVDRNHDGRPDGRPIVDRNGDGKPDGRNDGRPFIDRNHDGRPDGFGDARPGDGRPTRGVIKPEPDNATVRPQTPFPTPQGPGTPQTQTPAPAVQPGFPARGPDAQRPNDRREGDRDGWRQRGPEGVDRGDRGDWGHRGRDGRQDPVRVAPPTPPRIEQPRVEQPRIEAPRPEPRMEPPRFERPQPQPQPQPRMEQPRIEAPRPMPQPRMEAPRAEPPRPAPRVEPPRAEPPRRNDGASRQQER
ncbi:DUF6600 domain-containing protein [Mitsuaria sp. GD03876]|uniref:DUF6600 domain-containing protein n=1 Tax=Mitsuaria sp. GD03876 TaxID=2975399 RepID=UPI00244B8C6A|nr:DUF6600 domain-containing protein [Mitsuaria sp. GD03876]MDH0864332.1 hypothetical protein [Mitsuaria sp. GD03876]